LFCDQYDRTDLQIRRRSDSGHGQWLFLVLPKMVLDRLTSSWAQVPELIEFIDMQLRASPKVDANGTHSLHLDAMLLETVRAASHKPLLLHGFHTCWAVSVNLLGLGQCFYITHRCCCVECAVLSQYLLLV
jgi:hypothetical protein